MKYFISFAISLVVLGCLEAQNWSNGNKIKGTGPVITKTLDLDAFDGFNLAISGNVILQPGSTQKVEVKAKANIIDNLRTEVKKGFWDIGFNQNVSYKEEITIFITLPTLSKVSITGSGNITTQGQFVGLSKLEVTVTGSGDLQLNADADALSCAISGSGDIAYAGTVPDFRGVISGSGDISGYELETERAQMSISGSGDCKLSVSQNLEASIVGSGDIYYKGNATVQSAITGSGDVYKK